MHVLACVCVRVWIGEWVRGWAHVCVGACVRVWVRVCGACVHMSGCGFVCGGV